MNLIGFFLDRFQSEIGETPFTITERVGVLHLACNWKSSRKIWTWECRVKMGTNYWQHRSFSIRFQCFTAAGVNGSDKNGKTNRRCTFQSEQELKAFWKVYYSRVLCSILLCCAKPENFRKARGSERCLLSSKPGNWWFRQTLTKIDTEQNVFKDMVLRDDMWLKKNYKIKGLVIKLYNTVTIIEMRLLHKKMALKHCSLQCQWIPRFDWILKEGIYAYGSSGNYSCSACVLTTRSKSCAAEISVVYNWFKFECQWSGLSTKVKFWQKLILFTIYRAYTLVRSGWFIEGGSGVLYFLWELTAWPAWSGKKNVETVHVASTRQFL